MRSFASNDSDSGSYRKAARRDDTPKSLYDHANSLFLSVAGRADDRHILPPEKIENHRDRYVLAELIEIVAPNVQDPNFGSNGNGICIS